MYRPEIEPIVGASTGEQAARKPAPDPHVLTLQNPEASKQDVDIAFSGIYGQYSGPLYGYLLKMVKSPELAEEALQESMLRAWKGIGTFDPNTSFSSWIYKVAKNTTLNMIRNSKKYRESESSVDPPVLETRKNSGRSDPVERAIFRAEIDLISSLHEPFQEALAWDAGAKSDEQIAIENGLSIRAVKSRKFRAREAYTKAVARMELTEAEKEAEKEAKKEERRARRKAREQEEREGEELAVAA